jgi:hypothetical protein
MALRTDLVHKLTPAMLLKSVLANKHRYKPERLLAATGVGSPTPTTPAGRRRERKLRKSLKRSVLRLLAP